jgi:hypothetical protein
MFNLVTGIVASLAENERRNIAERCLSGRIAARNRGVKFGRKEGVKESDTTFLSKPKVKEIVKDLQKGYPYLVIAKNRDCGVSLVQKVNKILKAKQPKEVKDYPTEIPSTPFVNEPMDADWDSYGPDGEKPITWNVTNIKPTGMARWEDVIKK